MSLISSFYTGVSGLRASQNSLNTTAHNLANTETKGYSRQQVLQADSGYYRWGTTHLSTLEYGYGVDISAVKQVRDVFLDKSYRKEIGRQGFYEAQNEAVDEIESIFGEMEGVTFQDCLEDLWTSLEELQKDPSDTARNTLIDSADNFIERAELVSEQLKEYQVNLNSQITSKVNRINQIAKDIYSLNKQILKVESSGVENANDLRDERNNLLDELGQIINITYKETDGEVSVYAEGMTLVTEDRTYQMGTVKVSNSTNMLKPVWTSYNNADVYNMNIPPSTEKDTDIGSLKGLLIARGTEVANYTYNYQRTDFTSETAFDNAAEKYAKDTEPSIIMTVQAQFDMLIHGIVTTINDILCPNVDVTLSDGTKLKVLSSDAPVGMDSDSTQGEALFGRKSVDRYRKPTAAEISNSGGKITADSKIYIEENPNNNYSLFTLGEIEINPEIAANKSKLPLSKNAGTKEYDIDTIGKITTKWQEAFATISPDSLIRSNFNNYYTAMITEIGNRGDQYDEMCTNQANLAGSIDNQRQETSGVSSDEELTNLIKYQHAYNASSRYITTVSDMLEHIINSLGR